jgi:thimet oligopeptidase
MLNVEDIILHTTTAINQSKNNYKNILNYNLSEQNYEAFLSMVVNEENYTTTMIHQLIFWQYVGENEDIRKASSNADLEFSKYMIDVYMNEQLYVKLFEYYQTFSCKLSVLQRRYLRNLIRSFDIAGACLNKTKKNKLKIVENNLVEIERMYVNNINNYVKTILLNDNELKGLPVSNIQEFPINEETGKRIIDFKYPTYKNCMKHIDNSEIRKLIDYEYNTICKETNTKLLVDMLLLRNEKAKILGMKNYASLVQAQLMIKDPKDVSSFLDDMHPTFDMLFLEEFRCLLRLKEQDCKLKNIDFDEIINPWDISYYFYITEKKIIGEEELENMSNYFSLEQVQTICFNLCKYLFGIRFVKKVNKIMWHRDVETYCIIDDKSNKELGTLYLDLFPRNNKYNHTACFTIIPYCEYYNEKMESINVQNASVALVGNFTPSNKSAPSLLTHNEVVIFFHELGHAIHNICGRIGLVRLSGTNVEQDFVEAPSQMFENWCWEKNVLNQFKHWKTGEPLSVKTIDKLIKKRTLHNGFHYKRQLALAKFDQMIHSYKPFLNKLKEVRDENVENACENAEKVLIDTFKTIYDGVCKSNKIKSPKFSINMQEGTFMPANWGHLVGYDGRYYCYLWSEVFADCMFNARFKNNIFDKEAGLDYRTIILNTGGSVKASTMIQKFIRGKPSLESFFENKIYVVRGIIDNDDYASETSTECITSVNPITMMKFAKPLIDT